MNAEIVKLSKEVDHWKMRTDEQAMSRHQSSLRARALKQEAVKTKKLIGYLEDRILDAYGEIKREDL
jgi:hypothetical protein